VYEYIHTYVQIYIQDTPFPARDLQNSTFNLHGQSILIDNIKCTDSYVSFAKETYKRDYVHRSSTDAIPEFLAEQIEPGAFERIGRHAPSPDLIHEAGKNSQKSSFGIFYIY